MSQLVITTEAAGLLDDIANAGLCVSFAYGPCGDNGVMWSVDVLCGYESFEKPFAAKSFEHAIRIASIESFRRGWL